MPRPMLDDLELQQVQTIELDGDQVWVQHDIPALEGDFLQGLGRRAGQFTLTGVLTGAEVADGLKSLRDKFRAAAPVAFVADIATATRIDQVLIEEMGVRELAGKPARFEYAFTLREYVPATPPGRVEPPPPPIVPPPPVQTATLIVTVIVDGQPAFDHDETTITVTSTATADNPPRTRTLPNNSRTQANVWEEADSLPGSYTVTATTAGPNPMTGSKPAVVVQGATTEVTITLREEANIAETFVIHYWFDKAFVEPCMRPVMRQIANYAASHPDKKLLIVGHTDLVGSDQYNQSLSERRARGAYAYLTAGGDLTTAVAEWNELRQPRQTGTTRTVHDTWGVRQYQQMLQELRYYSGPITDQKTTQTDAAIRAFQTDNGLTVDGVMGDESWPVLIRAYLSLDLLAVPDAQLLPNARDGCDGGKLKWLGCSELDPLKNTEDAWRPNRRTEFLFVTAEQFPHALDIPEPVTFGLPALQGTTWCLGGSAGPACCFVKPYPGIQRRTPCSQPPADAQWDRRPVEPETVVLQGTLTFADGRAAADIEYVLTAPDGEFMNGERDAGPDRGRPIHGRTDAQGRLAESPGTVGYPGKPKRIGVFTLEVKMPTEPFVAYLADESPTSARGLVVCKRIEQDSDSLDVIIQPGTRGIAAALAVTDNVDPFDTAVARVQIEGILNQHRGSFDLTDLFGTQANSLFRIRADLPGVSAATVQARMTALANDGSTIETHTLTLTRTSGVRFVSLPVLAIPRAIPRSDITFTSPATLEVVRTHAGGKLRVELLGVSVPLSPVEVAVRGRVLEFCTVTIQGAAPTINADMTVANRVMAQCGIEFRILRQSTVNNLALLDIQQPSCPLTIGGDTNRGPEEQALFALGRADCASNFIVYFVRSNSLGLLGCSAYPVGQPGVTVADTASRYTFCHEIGHVLHLPHDGRANNLMTGAGTSSLPANAANVHLAADQCALLDGSGFLVFRE